MIDHPAVVTSETSSLIETALDEMMAVEMMAREKQLYAAWRAGYDFLYVVSQHSITDFSLDFIPSDDGERYFRGNRVERYDLREESLSQRDKEILEDFRVIELS